MTRPLTFTKVSHIVHPTSQCPVLHPYDYKWMTVVGCKLPVFQEQTGHILEKQIQSLPIQLKELITIAHCHCPHSGTRTFCMLVCHLCLFFSFMGSHSVRHEKNEKILLVAIPPKDGAIPIPGSYRNFCVHLSPANQPTKYTD